jgi:hydrogenase/urease accessory protein HupE
MSETRYRVSLRTPTGASDAAAVFPDDCRRIVEATPAATLSQFSQHFDLLCARSLRGRTVSVTGLGGSAALAVVDVSWENDEPFSTVLGPARPSIDLPERGERSDVVRRYVAVGARHIATGIDHLLVVMGLYVLAESRKKLVLAVSAFTVAHSLTLALASLGFVSIRPALAEVWIGLSLVLLGIDVVRVRNARLVPLAFVFGLVHGLGFASGLREIGLMKSQLLTALVSFNLGVELGQLAFVALLVSIAVLARFAPIRDRVMKNPAQWVGYAVGSLGAYFTLLRVGAMLRR